MEEIFIDIHVANIQHLPHTANGLTVFCNVKAEMLGYHTDTLYYFNFNRLAFGRLQLLTVRGVTICDLEVNCGIGVCYFVYSV